VRESEMRFPRTNLKSRLPADLARPVSPLHTDSAIVACVIRELGMVT
jgi:hypothetical protein